MALLTVFHSINSPDNSLLSHSGFFFFFFFFLLLFLPFGPFNYVSLYESLLKRSQRSGVFALRCDPFQGRKGSWKLRYTLAAVQHVSLAWTSNGRVVG